MNEEHILRDPSYDGIRKNEIEVGMLSGYKKKTDYTVSVKKVEPGTTCYNHLEDAHYTATEGKNMMITGTDGEQWMTSAEKVLKTYNFSNEKAQALEQGLSVDVSPKADASIIFARPAEGMEQVETSWGETLTANRPEVRHGNGDMVVYYASKDGLPNPLDRAIVNGVVFENTYVRTPIVIKPNPKARTRPWGSAVNTGDHIIGDDD